MKRRRCEMKDDESEIEGENMLSSRYSKLEMEHIRAYLKEKGHTLADLHKMPAEKAKALLAQANAYASARMAEVEARARFRKEIHGPKT